jgi:hypothetical protein
MNSKPVAASPAARIWRHEWVPKNFTMADSHITKRYYSPEEVDAMLEAYAAHKSLSGEAIDQACREAAEEVEATISDTYGESWHGCQDDVAKMFKAAIEKARSK